MANGCHARSRVYFTNIKILDAVFDGKLQEPRLLTAICYSRDKHFDRQSHPAWRMLTWRGLPGQEPFLPFRSIQINSESR